MKRKIIPFIVFVFTLSSNSLFAADELRDVKPPVLLPANYWPLIFIIIIVILGILGLFLRKLFSENRTVEKKDARLPYEIALMQLDELVKQKYVYREKLKEFYSELSEILRVYIEGQYRIKALDMTTEEFLNHIKRSRQWTNQQRDVLKHFLNKSDLVKFAKYGPTNEENEESIILIRQFVNETKQLTPKTEEIKNGI